MVERGCYSDAVAVMFHTWELVLQDQTVVHSKKHRFGKDWCMKLGVVGLTCGDFVA